MIQETATVERGPFEMIPHWLLDAEVSSHAMRLYLILRRHGNSNGVCFPGRKRLATQMHASTSTIDRARGELVQVGAICYRVRMSDDGDYTSNEYHVHWHSSPNCGFYSDEGSPACDDTSPACDDRGILTGDELTNTHKEPKQTNLDIYNQRFEEFWSVYPKRVGRKAAATKWRTAVKTANPDLIIEAATKYRDNPKRDPDFTANPATWLNQERWLDEPATAPKVKTGPIPVMDLYADEPCEHGDPLGKSRCALCRHK